LRLGHRISRDKRMTTHLGLTARAFGAHKMIIEGEHDSHLSESIGAVVGAWGGGFRIEYTDGWRKTLKDFDGVKVHLTMYGLELNKKIGEIRGLERDVLVVVGGQKVPSEMYGLVDYNISVGTQPHSEVAALAVFLDRLFDGREFDKKFHGGKLIVPQERGKKIV